MTRWLTVILFVFCGATVLADALGILFHSAEGGDPRSQYKLGQAYYHGEEIYKDKAEAVKWYRLAAEQGYATAQVALGQMYERGDGVFEHDAEAVKWYLLAAVQGSIVAQFRLGIMYRYGHGVLVDEAEALKWFQLAAEQGSERALLRLRPLLTGSLGSFIDNQMLESSRHTFEQVDRLISGGFHAKAEVLLIKLAGKSTKNNDLHNLELLNILRGLADVSFHRGDFIKSLGFYEDGLEITKKHFGENSIKTVVAMDMLARNLLEVKEFDRAKAVLDQAILIYADDGYTLGSLRRSLGNTEAAQGLDPTSNYLEAKTILEKSYFELPIPYRHVGLSALYQDLGAYYSKVGDFTRAELLFRQAKKQHFFASEELRKANVWQFKDITSPDDLLKIDQGLETVFIATQQQPAALKILKDNFIEIKNFYTNLSTPSRQVSFTKDQYLRSLITKLTQSLNFEKSRELQEMVFGSFQLVSRNNTAKVAASMAARTMNADHELSKLLREQQDMVVNIERIHENLLGLIKSDMEKYFEYQQSLEVIERSLSKLSSKIKQEFPLYLDYVAPNLLTISEAQSLLSPDEAILTFISDAKTDMNYAFLVRKNYTQSYKIDLSVEQLVDIIGRLRNGIDLTDALDTSKLPEFDLDIAHKLYVKLLGPIEDMLEGIKHLLVVPTGPLESLPLNLLVTKPRIAKGTKFKNYQAAAWLPKSFSLTRLPSITSLKTLRLLKTKNRATDSFKGFGDPILDGKLGQTRGLKLVDFSNGFKMDSDKAWGLPELPETSDELKLIAKYLNSPEDNLYLRERATETEVKAADLSNSRIIAFATHGLIRGEISGLDEPALVLTSPTEGSDLDDGLLKASEVAQLKLNADMVLLSACNTASDNELGARGLSSLARAFIYAGARSLLVSHWSVDSDAAAELTTGLFEALDTNPEMGRAEALQSSMMALASDDENPQYSHPAFWAPFSLIGEGGAPN